MHSTKRKREVATRTQIAEYDHIETTQIGNRKEVQNIIDKDIMNLVIYSSSRRHSLLELARTRITSSEEGEGQSYSYKKIQTLQCLDA